jgi:hypothetical protein
MERSPFNIPRRAGYTKLGVSLSTIACIREMTPERVKGSIPYSGTKSQAFNVKHDGKSFAVGSGSSKMRFYFSDWEKVPAKA